MSSALQSRIAALEAKSPQRQRRVVTVESGEGQEAEVRQLLLSEGIDPDADDQIIIIHSFVSPAGEEPWSDPPAIVSVTDEHGNRRRFPRALA